MMKTIGECGTPVAVLQSIAIVIACCSCRNDRSEIDKPKNAIAPRVITERVKGDSDDPAIWIHPTDPAQSLILGTDKGGTFFFFFKHPAALFAFDLNGKIKKSVTGFARLNNVDVEYGLMLDGKPTDIAVATDRDAGKLYVFRLPDLVPIDAGGFEAFAGERQRRAMGVALYRRPTDGTIFAIVSRKEGPAGRYLWQYLLEDGGNGQVKLTKVREFGEWSGKNAEGEGEIEAVAVDDALGFVYYSDELFGIRKYHADPEAPDANQELAHFGTSGFAGDREGISIYALSDSTGYLIVSDQQADRFRIYTREGSPGNPHDHRFIKAVRLSTKDSDGSEVTSVELNQTFPGGLFVAMSADRRFQLYSWDDIAGKDLTQE